MTAHKEESPITRSTPSSWSIPSNTYMTACEKVHKPRAVGAQRQGRRQCPQVSDEYHQNGTQAQPASYVCDIQLLMAARILILSRFAKSNIAAAVSSRLSKKIAAWPANNGCHTPPNDYQRARTKPRRFRQVFWGRRSSYQHNTGTEGRTTCQIYKQCWCPVRESQTWTAAMPEALDDIEQRPV